MCGAFDVGLRFRVISVYGNFGTFGQRNQPASGGATSPKSFQHPSVMAEPQNQAAKPPVDNPFPHTNAFIQLIEAQAEQNVAFNKLLQALHDLNTTITMNQAAEVDEGVLVAQFVSAMTEGMILNPVISADGAVLEANIAFQNELKAFIEQVHLISESSPSISASLFTGSSYKLVPSLDHPPQNGHGGTLAMAAGGALLTVGAVAVGPALALGALNVVGFSSAGPVAGPSIINLSLLRNRAYA